MVDPVSLAASISIVKAAGDVLKPAINKVEEYYDKGSRIKNRLDTAGSSITSLSKQTTILSRVFIDEAIVDEIVLPNFMKSVHEWYCAQLVAALQLTNMVDSKKTVQDVISTIQTGYNLPTRALEHIAYDNLIAQESLSGFDVEDLGLEANSLVTEQTAAKMREKDKWKDHPVESTRSIKVSDNRVGPMGELYEIKLNNPADPSHSIVVPVYIQMQPSIIPYEFAARFIDLNVMPSLWQRWVQMTAGEISFWKEFVAGLDIIKRNQAPIKNPESAAAFTEFLKTVNKKDVYALADVSGKLGTRPSHNLANSVMVFSEDAVRNAKVESAVDLHNAHDRARYFRDTYTMIVAIIDPLHQRVTVYFNGIDGDLDLSYSDFKPKDSKFDPNDFMVALQAFSTNQVGRLR